MRQSRLLAITFGQALQLVQDLANQANSDDAEVPAGLVVVVVNLADTSDKVRWQDTAGAEFKIAVDQLKVDAENYELNLPDSRQRDGSPGPRFWAAARLLAERYSRLSGVDVNPFVAAFTRRERGHRTKPEPVESDDSEETEADAWAERRSTRARVLALHRESNGTLNSAAIARQLCQSGLSIGQPRVAAILKSLKRA